MAAGKGTRMKSQIPKVLHRICGTEMVSLVVDAARQAGLDRIVVVVPKDAHAFRDVVGKGASFAEQTEPLGTGHALLQAQPSLNAIDNVVVLSGDVPLTNPQTIGELIRLHVPDAGVYYSAHGQRRQS